jgi:hypothetical protein
MNWSGVNDDARHRTPLEASVMDISHEDVRDITLHWLRERHLKPACPLCHSKTWKVGMVIALPDAFGGGGGFRVIPLVCSTCAYTMFLDADPIAPPTTPPPE